MSAFDASLLVSVLLKAVVFNNEEDEKLFIDNLLSYLRCKSTPFKPIDGTHNLFWTIRSPTEFKYIW